MSIQRIKKFILLIIIIFGLFYIYTKTVVLKRKIIDPVKTGKGYYGQGIPRIHMSLPQYQVYEPQQVNFHNDERLDIEKSIETTATHMSLPQNVIGKKLPFNHIHEPHAVRFPSDEQLNLDTFNKTQAIHMPLPQKIVGKKLPFDQVYEPRHVKLPSDVLEMNKSSETKVIILWTPWNGLLKTINYYSLQLGRKSFLKNKCPNTNCIVTRSRKKLAKADAVLFHLLDTRSKDLPAERSLNQVWIMYNMEAPWMVIKHVQPELSHLKDKFNWTMTYRSDSTIPVRYGFIEKANTKQPILFQNKTRNIAWFVSDCKTDSKREDYVKELTKYIDVDIYGTCGNYKCYPSQSATCYNEVLKKYKFYLSFENSVCKDYVTEKFFNVFNYDIIPIVFGGAMYQVIAPPETFIDATKYSNPKALAQVLLQIGDNREHYEQFLQRKKYFRAYLDPWMCRLCSTLHAKTQSAVMSDVEEWWIKDAQCKYWDKEKLDFLEKASNLEKVS